MLAPARVLVTILALSLGVAGCVRHAETRPNVVLIVIDLLRADAVSAYGARKGTSPELDELAASGVRFERVVAQNTWTRPSHASLLTSEYPRTIGIYDAEGGESLPSRFETLAEVLRAAGYRTIGATANPNINGYYGFAEGFDVYADSEVVRRPEEAPAGTEARIVGRRGRRGKRVAFPSARVVFERILEAVDRSEGPPWYVQANLMEVHSPALILGDDALGGKGAADEPLELRMHLAGLRAASREIGWFRKELSARRGWENTLFVVTSDHGETFAEHASVGPPLRGTPRFVAGKSLARKLRRLPEPDLCGPGPRGRCVLEPEETIRPGVREILHPQARQHGLLVYETQALVPLILHNPNGSLPKGRVVERPVRLLDVMPTILDFCGVAGPATMKGISLRPLLAGEDAPGPDAREPFIVETEYRRANKIAVYDGEWKYIENRDGAVGTRPAELQRGGALEDGIRTDQAASHPAIVERLARALRDWEAGTPKSAPTHASSARPSEHTEQLRALGYLQ